MKRHPALHGLSRDHHLLLLHARRLEGRDARVGTVAAVAAYRRFQATVLDAHLEEEQAAVLPHLPPGLREVLKRGEELLRTTAHDAAMAAGALRAHVQACEHEAFPALQESEVPWATITAAAQAVRKARRPLADAGEECFL